MTRYRLSPEAESDLDDIKRYLMQQGGARLARFILHEIGAPAKGLTHRARCARLNAPHG